MILDYYLLVFKKYKAIVFCLFFIVISSSINAKVVHLDYFGYIPTASKDGKIDTLNTIDIFRRFYWDVEKSNTKDDKVKFTTSLIDTIKIGSESAINLSTTFTVNKNLVNQVYSLYYKSVGSLLFTLNHDTLIATGLFQTDKNSKLRNKYYWDFVNITFKDTIEKINIVYIPAYNFNKIHLNIEFLTLKDSQKSQEANTSREKKGNAHGFYYLAFGIIFLFFFYFLRNKVENLYFALFCIFASITFLIDNNYRNEYLNRFGFISLLLLLEFLSHFFAKVIINKQRSFIPLFVILGTSILILIPSVYYSSEILIFGYKISLISEIINPNLILYTIMSSLYYFLQGFRKRGWEAKSITFICLGATLFSIGVPIIVSIFSEIMGVQNPQSILEDILFIGFFIYPLSGAYVLGKRNGINQTELLRQIESIKTLSRENIEKEKEKKQILENINYELERKVDERTIEVVRQKMEIERKKELIEIKNKAITDNVTYALRIQSAILPDVKHINKTLKKSFILYMPKDIVSGDFYAYFEVKDRCILIAADCTGHGVSGAFMSMIGSSLLNHIINEKGIYEPAIILTHLNTSIIDALKQNENETNDGMDIAVVSFYINSSVMQYASANRPIWLIRDKELIVFKPDKLPIGGLQVAKNKVFTNNSVQLYSDDTVYIFTDGYADQFGGEKGKKLMTARLKEFLLSLNSKSMQEQEICLKEFFEKWKGDEEQMDDVLIIGVRI